MLHANVVDGVHRIEDACANRSLVEEDGRLTVVDTGVPTSWKSFTGALARLRRRPDDVEAIVLTHGHFDHLGFAERARSQLRVPVYVHEDDVPLTKHPRRYGHERARSYYFLTQVQAFSIVTALVANRAWWPKPIAEVTRLAEGILSVPGSPRLVFTPGHTLGHVVLHLPERDTVIAGDAIVTLDPYRNSRGPQIVSRAATADSERAPPLARRAGGDGRDGPDRTWRAVARRRRGRCGSSARGRRLLTPASAGRSERVSIDCAGVYRCSWTGS